MTAHGCVPRLALVSDGTKRVVDLELFGQRFTVNTDTDAERVRDIVDFVNRRLETIRDASRRVQTDQIALLAALNIAEELFSERDRRRSLKRSVRDRSMRLLDALDSISKEVEVASSGAVDAERPARSHEVPLPGA